MPFIIRFIAITSIFLSSCSSPAPAPIVDPWDELLTDTAQTSSISSSSSMLVPITPTTATAVPNPDVSLMETITQINKIALLLPLQGHLGSAGRAIRDGFLAAYREAKQQAATNATVTVYDTSSEAVQTLYQQAVSHGANIVIGPLDKAAVQMLSQGHISIPTLMLNYLSTATLATKSLYYFGLSPQDEAQQAADKMWQKGYRATLTITLNDVWGQSVLAAFQTRWLALGGKIVGSMSYLPQQDLREPLRHLLHFHPSNNKSLTIAQAEMQRRQDADSLFLIATPTSARQILPLLKFYYAGAIPVYATSLIYDGYPQPQLDRDLDGVTFCDIPWVIDTLSTHPNVYQQLATADLKHFQTNIRLYALGIDSYALVSKLASPLQTAALKIAGTTGTLTVDKQHRIVRLLEWSQFHNGLPILMTDQSDTTQ